MHPHQLEEFTLRSKVIPSLQLIQQATINAAKLFNMEKEIGLLMLVPKTLIMEDVEIAEEKDFVERSRHPT